MTGLVLGIDVGLSGVRAVVLDRSGQVVAAAREPAACDSLAAGAILALVCRTVRAACGGIEAGAISALCLCAFGPAPVILTADGKVADRVRMIGPDAPGMADGDDLAARIIAARRAHPAAWADARWLCDLTGYLVYCLTGELVLDSASADDFSALAIDGLPALPRVLPPTALCGGLTGRAAQEIGLREGLPVAAGCYDSTADLAAAGFGPDRPACIVLGSTLVLGRLTEVPLGDAGLSSARHVGQGWLSGGWTNFAGAALDLADRWVRPDDGPQPSGGGPLVLPHFRGERAPLWDAAASGTILGLTPGTTAGDLRRAFREAVALSALDIADRLAGHLEPADAWVVTGGGTRNAPLVQDAADALGARIEVVAGADRSLGPAALAARAMGVPLTFAPAAQVLPRPDRSAWFRRRLGLYRQAQAAVAPLYQALQQDRGREGDRP